MRNLIVFFFLNFIPLLSLGQFHTSIDLIFSVDYNKEAIGFLEIDDNYNLDRLISTYNYRYGANFNTRIFDNVLFKTGMRFAEVGFITQSERFNLISHFGDFVPQFKTSYQFRFIELPLVLRYEFGENKTQFYSEAGISPHFYLNSHKVEVYDMSTNTSTLDDNVERTNFAFVFAVGANFRISKYFQLFVQHTIRIFKENSRIYRGVPTNHHPVGYGLELGIRRALTLNEEK